MYSINSNKKLGFPFLTLPIVLLSIVSIVFGTISSSANSVSHEKNLEDGRFFSNLKETERFGFLTNNITTLFDRSGIGQISFSPQPSRSEKIGIADSTVFDEFDAWVGFYVGNGFSADGEQMNLGENLAVRRRQALEELIQTNPKAAFEKAIPAEIFKRLPSSITEHSEQRISANGDFLVYIFDEMNRSNESRIDRYVVIGDSRYEAVVYGRRAAMTTKLNIPLQGIIIGDTMVVDENPVRKMDSAEYAERVVDESKLGAGGVAAEVGGKVVYFSDPLNFSNFVREQIEWESKIGPVRPRENLAPDELATAWTEGAKTVLVIRVDFSDKPGEPLDHYNQPLTATRAQNLINNEVNPFYVNSSYNKTSMQATVTPVVRLPQLRSFYAQGTNYNIMLNDARAAARAAGFETNNFNLDIVAFSYTSTIGWAGLAGVGGKGNLLNGAFYMQETAHELGHNYGLLHANLWRTTDGSPIGQGSNIEYGDCYDDMGACVNMSVNAHFNTRYKRLLDWLTDANVQTVTSNGTYRIFAQDSTSPGGIRTLKIQKDSTKNYWIEFRQLFQSALNGALIRWDYASENFQETQLLDMTPNTSAVSDSSLLIGQSFYDSASQIRITVMGKGNTTPESLDVKVELGQSTGGCTFSLAPTSTSVGANGGTGTINVTAGTGCAWTATSNASWITITGGASGIGNGSVSYFVQPNTNSSRTGTITIGGQTFTVSQAAGVSTTPSLSIDNVSLNEGNSGTTAFNFTASLSAVSSQTVSANFVTANGTAVGGQDYTTANSMINFSPGETSKNITIQIVGDTSVEPDETFTVNLSSATGATISVGQGTGTILNDDVATACTFSISPTNVNVAAAGATGNTISVITQPGCQWNAASNDSWITVTSGSSGTGNGTVSYTVQQNINSSRTGTITVAGQTFTVSQTAGATTTPVLSIDNVSLNEGNSGTTAFNFTVNLSAVSNQTVSVNFATANGSAVAGQDYTTENGTVAFFPGETSKNITVQVIGDTSVEPNETFTVNLSGAAGATIANSQGTGTIFNDDVATACTLSISPTIIDIVQAGAVNNRITVTAQAGCQWNAASNNSWITVTSGNSGTGNGTIRYSVAANEGGERTGTITVGGQTFTINQAASVACFCSQARFDFDGDGKADVSVFRPSNGGWYLNQSANGFTGIAFGVNGDRIAPADYDGDGKTDIAVYRGGTWYLNRSQLGFTGVVFGQANDVPQPSDFDGDGKAELAVFRPSNGYWYAMNLVTNEFNAVQFGQAGDQPVAADYDGDGRADYAVFRNGGWYVLRSQLGFIGVGFGTAGDKPAPADYDGDGKADFAVFRPSNGTWYLQQSTAGFAGLAFGISTDIPSPADYDGDGRADVAVFRPSNGTWYLQQSTNGFTGAQFGANGDKPVPGAFVQ